MWDMSTNWDKSTEGRLSKLESDKFDTGCLLVIGQIAMWILFFAWIFQNHNFDRRLEKIEDQLKMPHPTVWDTAREKQKK
jgi:hypothetical protein